MPGAAEGSLHHASRIPPGRISTMWGACGRAARGPDRTGRGYPWRHLMSDGGSSCCLRGRVNQLPTVACAEWGACARSVLEYYPERNPKTVLLECVLICDTHHTQTMALASMTALHHGVGNRPAKEHSCEQPCAQSLRGQGNRGRCHPQAGSLGPR